MCFISTAREMSATVAKERAELFFKKMGRKFGRVENYA